MDGFVAPPLYISLLWILSVVCFAVYLIKKNYYFLHMMQQNSYRNKRFINWAWEHVNKAFYLLRDLGPVFAIQIIRFVEGEKAMIIGLSWVLFCCAINALTYRKNAAKETKKELVMTPRAKRLNRVTNILIIAFVLLAIAPTLYMGSRIIIGITLMLFGAFFALLFIVIANIILMPLESKINKGYEREAHQMVISINGLKVIGITGSFGKTSTKMILGEILSKKYNTLVTPESYNTPMGVTKTIREHLRPTHEVFVAEMGAKQKGDIKEICDLVVPQMGIITSIGEQHLESFKTLQAIIQTKYELAQCLPPNAPLVLNFDDKNIRENIDYVPDGCLVISYGYKNSWDYYAAEIEYSPNGSLFNIHTKDGQVQEFRTVLLGRHNVYNITGAVAMAHQLGVSLEEAAKAVKTLPQVTHRLSHTTTAAGYHILDDAFNSNPVGARAALEVLSKFKGGKRILVTPGMVEMGHKQKELNRQFAIDACKCCDYIILVGRGITEPLQEGLRQMNYPKKRYFVALTLKEAREELQRIIAPGDTVLFENDLPDTYTE